VVPEVEIEAIGKRKIGVFIGTLDECLQNAHMGRLEQNRVQHSLRVVAITTTRHRGSTFFKKNWAPARLERRRRWQGALLLLLRQTQQFQSAIGQLGLLWFSFARLNTQAGAGRVGRNGIGRFLHACTDLQTGRQRHGLGKKKNKKPPPPPHPTPPPQPTPQPPPQPPLPHQHINNNNNNNNNNRKHQKTTTTA
jgi:hypothetical protein